MVVFPCHVCRTQLSADDAQAGQLVRCPTCLTTLRVPAGQGGPAGPGVSVDLFKQSQPVEHSGYVYERMAAPVSAQTATAQSAPLTAALAALAVERAARLAAGVRAAAAVPA